MKCDYTFPIRQSIASFQFPCLSNSTRLSVKMCSLRTQAEITLVTSSGVIFSDSTKLLQSYGRYHKTAFTPQYTDLKICGVPLHVKLHVHPQYHTKSFVGFVNGTWYHPSIIKMHRLIAIKRPLCLGFSPFITD